MNCSTTGQVYRCIYPQLRRRCLGIIDLCCLLFRLFSGRWAGNKPRRHRVPFRIILFRVYLLPGEWFPYV